MNVVVVYAEFNYDLLRINKSLVITTITTTTTTTTIFVSIRDQLPGPKIQKANLRVMEGSQLQ